MVNGIEGWLLNVALLLLHFAMAFFPVAVVRLWVRTGFDSHYRPANEPPTQFHLSTWLILVLIAGAGLGALSRLNFERFDEQFKTVLLLFVALALLTFDILETGAPSRERLLRYRVIQCYPRTKSIRTPPQRRTPRRITLRFY